MLTLERHGDVTRLRFASRRSRLAGYSVSAYEVRGQLIDTGFHAARADLQSYVRARRPRGVLVTHHHEDHAGNIELLASLGLPLLVADSTLAAVRAEERIGFYRRFTWGEMPPLRSAVVPFRADGLQLVHTGSHSPDHHVVWDAGTRTLFAGDLFLGVKVRVSHHEEDLRSLARVVREFASLGPERMFDAHRGLVAEPVSALTAKADWLDATIAEVDARIAAGQTDETIRRDVLGGEELAGWFSRGEYSRLNFVRGLRASGRASPSASPTPASFPAG